MSAPINHENARKMKALLKASKLTAGNAGKAWDVSRAAIYTWTSGVNFPTAATVEKVRAWFEAQGKAYDLEWFVAGPSYVSGSCRQTKPPAAAVSAGNVGGFSSEAAQ